MPPDFQFENRLLAAGARRVAGIDGRAGHKAGQQLLKARRQRVRRLLAQVGTDAQKDWWLKPVVAGEMRSAFAMTEPHPGGGSDPGMMLTTARRDGDDYVVHGHKWFITGAAEAARAVRDVLEGGVSWPNEADAAGPLSDEITRS